MNEVPPVPLPRSKNPKMDSMTSSATSPCSELPPTPAKRPIPLPRMVGNSIATLTRRSSNPIPTPASNSEKEKVGMGHSLDGMQELFRTISFPSPLEENELNFEKEPFKHPHTPKSVSDIEIAGRDTPPSPEPPFYPPPPLPDESVYDEVQSLPGSKSSPWFPIIPRPYSQPSTAKQWTVVDDELVEDNYNDSTHSQHYSGSLLSWPDSQEDRAESIYEDIADTLEYHCPAGGSGSQTGEYSSGSDKNSLSSKKHSVLSSDSWSFYDAVEINDEQEKVQEKDNEGAEKSGRVKLLSMRESCPEQYENVAIVTPSPSANSNAGNPFLWSSNQSTTRCLEPSTAEAQDRLFPGRMPLLIPVPAPRGHSPASCRETQSNKISSEQPSESEERDVFPEKPPVILRQTGRSFHRGVTQSVILEFDPLFDSNTKRSYTSPDQLNEIGKTAETSNEPPYGKIKKSGIPKEQNEGKSRLEEQRKEGVTKLTEKEQEKAKPIVRNTKVTYPQLPEALSEECQNLISSKNTSGKTGRSYDVSQSIQNKQDSSFQESYKEIHFGPPEPPPPPLRVDSIGQASVKSESEGESVSNETKDDDDTSLKSRRPSLRLPSQRWNNMKQHAKRFLNGKTGEKSTSTNYVQQQSASSEDPKLSVFYQQAVDDNKSLPKSHDSVVNSEITVNTSVQHSGLLYQVPSGAVGAVAGSAFGGAPVRWFSLSCGKLTWWREKSGPGPCSCLPLERLTSICIAQDRPNPNADGETLSCFELGVLGGKSNWIGRHGGGMIPPSHTLLLGCVSTSERRLWMQRLLESIVPPSCFPVHAMMDYTRAGCAFIKEGICGVWSKGWLLLFQRTLLYCLAGQKNAIEANLQYARCIKITKEEDGGGPSILVDTQGGHAIYVRPVSLESGSILPSSASSGVARILGSKSTISGWKSVLKNAAIESGTEIADQQLTLENIPVIVDKCLNFIYAHGGMSEGIYRRSGSNSSITRLLTAFKRDAWDVQLTRRDYSEYDVAAVLKRFFRDLPEPLLTESLHDQFCVVAEKKENKVKLYRELLGQLPSINYGTLRRLLAHLNFVHGQRERNLMPVDNLAAIWGPTLMHVEGNDSLGWSRRESEVVMDLVSLYTSLFDVSPEEEERERQMQEVLEKYHLMTSGSPGTSVPTSPAVPIKSSENSRAFPGGRMPPSGDLKVWVHILDELSNSEKGSKCIHVTLTPQKMSAQVVTELCEQLGIERGRRGLEEHVLGGALIRPFHPRERVLDAVLRWGYWDEVDRRDNFIALASSTLISEVASMAKEPLALSGDLRYADARSKTFKTYLFEFSRAKLSYYKDKRGSIKLAEWKIEDILWYLGHEPKRNPQSRWSITFINKNKKVLRSRDKPYFGSTIAGTSSEEMLRWAAAMLVGEHPEGLSFPMTTNLLQ